MRTRLAVAAFLLAVALPATAAAATPIAPPGVTAVRSHGVWEVRFASRAAGVYRRLAGRRVQAVCETLPVEAGDGTSSSSGSARMLRAPKRRAALSTGLRSAADYCYLDRRRAHTWELVAVVPTTPAGRVFLDEYQRVAELETALELAGSPPATTDHAVADAPRVRVAMDGPDASPPPGHRVGYWSDGSRAVVAILSAGGRRLFMSQQGDVFSTNVLRYLTGPPTFGEG